MSRLSNLIAKKIGEASKEDVGFKIDPRWAAGSVRGPDGTQRTIQADELAESMLCDAIILTSVNAKMVEVLVERVSQSLSWYMKTGAFQKRVDARVDQALTEILPLVDFVDAEKLGEFKELMRGVYEKAFEVRWLTRVEERVEQDLDEAVAEVREKFFSKK
jgi:hypothetical protein